MKITIASKNVYPCFFRIDCSNSYYKFYNSSNNNKKKTIIKIEILKKNVTTYITPEGQ